MWKISDSFPARFEMPNIMVNTIDMMAMCATKGGFPEPELSWISVDHEGHERTLEPPDVQTLEIYKEDDGTYRVTSTANVRGSQKVTCSVYNPTSKETLSVIKDVITGTPRIIFAFQPEVDFSNKFRIHIHRFEIDM